MLYILQIATSGDAIQVSGPPNSVQIRNTHIANSLHAFAVVIKEVSITYFVYTVVFKHP